jgi:hypothetical protein
MRVIDARRVLSADRRGSSWPVLVDGDDGPWFTKLRGAGQGTGALVAEVVVAEIAEAIGLNVPARVLVRFGERIESLDRDGELRSLLDASVGLNLGFAYLDGAREITAQRIDMVSRDDAAAIVWLDGLVMNPDRTARNPNLLWWHDRLWLVDHGASFGFQYGWSDVSESSTRMPVPGVEPHLLHERVGDLAEWDEIFAARLTREVVQGAIDQVPDDFLVEVQGVQIPRFARDDGQKARDDGREDRDEREWLMRRRAAYVAFLWKRLKAPRSWVGAAPAGQAQPRRAPPEWVRNRAR